MIHNNKNLVAKILLLFKLKISTFFTNCMEMSKVNEQVLEIDGVVLK